MTFTDRLRESLLQLLAYIPALIGALVILFAGYLLAKIVERATDHALSRLGLNRWLEDGGVLDAVERTGWRRSPSRLVANIVFWFLMFAVILLAANALGLSALANVFTELVSYIPSLIAAIVILLVGIVLGEFVDGLVMASAGSVHGGPMLARAGRVGVIILSIFMALQQLGVATEIVTVAFAIIFGALALAFALSFGLGNRDLAGEVTRAWYERLRAEREMIRRENAARAAREEGAEWESGAPMHQPVSAPEDALPASDALPRRGRQEA
ncbi:MAG TPA: mechanosensitive ion channel [Gemmatimonadaceae bacterium]|nr:mechanosensitive ion channel [Gemmatimonadaceae bacterium]